MQDYKIQLEFISPGLPGAGEGWGSIIDTDLVFDAHGLPFFPARRLKGALRESAQEIVEMTQLANILFFRSGLIESTFGKAGSTKGGQVVFNSLYFPQYRSISTWSKWMLQEYSNILSPDIIINTFTELRQQTSINEDGVAEDNSLRTVRVLKAGVVFEGTVYFHETAEEAIKLIALSCANLRHLGTMRNRGFGQVKCTLLNANKNITEAIIEQLAKEAD